jgi:hypothetical protein
MGPERRQPSGKRGMALAADFVRASRVVVTAWGPAWSLRPFAGESLGVWLVVFLGLALPAAVAFALFAL